MNCKLSTVIFREKQTTGDLSLFILFFILFVVILSIFSFSINFLHLKSIQYKEHPLISYFNRNEP